MDAAVADKLTELVLDALTQAVAEPAGMPLHAGKTEAGLFPSTSIGKSAAKKCLDEQWLVVVGSDGAGRNGRELYTATEQGLHYLVERASPRQVLEDFVRLLESRQGQVDELLAVARRMADGLTGLKLTLTAVLPQVTSARMPLGNRLQNTHHSNHVAVEGKTSTAANANGWGTQPMTASESLASPSVVVDNGDELDGGILSHLADWSASAGVAQDCPLPELYRSLCVRDNPPTIGQFHDCLRRLHEAGMVYLHPWTGPLYALPEPSFALLVGHEIAYYASARS